MADMDTSQLRAAFVQAQAQIMNNGTYEPVVVISKPLALSLLDEIERLRAERDDHKARLAIEAVTAPDADYDTMMDSLQARIRDLHAEIKRLFNGAWFVHGTDYDDYPLALFGDELSARRSADEQGYGYVVFWPFGKTWSEMRK